MTTQTTTTATDRAKARVATYPTPQLVTVLTMIDAKPSSPENSLIRHWLIDEVERRFPAASDAVGAAFEAADAQEQATGKTVAVDYVAVLIANIPADALS